MWLVSYIQVFKRNVLAESLYDKSYKNVNIPPSRVDSISDAGWYSLFIYLEARFLFISYHIPLIILLSKCNAR